MNNVKKFVSKNKVVFVGPVRNGAAHLERIFENIERIGRLFEDFSCVFVESDSIDNSLEILKAFKVKYPEKVHIITLGNLDQKIASRTCRIATARNIGLEYCENTGIIDSHNYYVHMCMDDVNTHPMLEEDFLSCFEYGDDDEFWAGMTANQTNYYDLWCLRCKDWVDYDCWYKVQNRPSYMSYDTAYNIYVKSKFIQIPKNYGLIEVDAAHGGFSLFKSKYAKGSRYRGVNADQTFEECDLVNFCRDVKAKGGKIFINSRLINMDNVTNAHNK